MNCKVRRLDLLRSGNMSDCEVQVAYMDCERKTRCRRIFRCHKIILVSASEEFQRMISDPNFQKNGCILLVSDASPDAYEALLLYIYTYEICCATSLEMCKEILYLANKYEMDDFVECYIEKLANQDWPVEVVLQIFQLANEYNSKDLMDLVAEKILPLAPQLLNDNSFLMLSVTELKALMTILKTKTEMTDKELVSALRKYQVCNRIRYNDMEKFQQFVEVTHLFGDLLFEVDGTLAPETEAVTTKEDSPENA
ncbi:uncharacterized protein LOC115621572 [Scaptodrosophila lebanonensis]|uniref:Uncharacterized protein LOC115621572 n=1 Tax=Drosophila lebanonensis TaxID=7225 RepID=A0A6J2T518_DROLE|nr:uncharacterized protein LOC115621572 [Scaptodrosophila lebanonensis]